MFRFFTFSMLALCLTACSAMEENPTPPNTIQQLTGVWENKAQHATLHFYSDETVKLIFPQHQPPVKMISSYQAVKDHQIGVALGGFWTGPMLVDLSHLAEGRISATLPDEEALEFHKQ